jgi:hypothetical protein
MSENEIDNRGSKSVNTVKEQRVDGSYTYVLRCTLRGLERDHRVRILSKKKKYKVLY